MREMDNQDQKERKRIEIEDDLRCLRNEFRHYIRQVWLFKNKDDNDLIGMRLGGAAGLPRRLIKDLFAAGT
jgi:hypothetical protein